MTAAIDTTAKRRDRFQLPLALRLALRDLRGGFAGFTIFLICIALGTGAIGAINSLSDCDPGCARPRGHGAAWRRCRGIARASAGECG